MSYNQQENSKTEIHFKHVISHHVVLFRKLLELGGDRAYSLSQSWCVSRRLQLCTQQKRKRIAALVTQERKEVTQHEPEKGRDLQAQWKEHVTIPVTNNERAGSLSDNKDQLFKAQITVTESQSKKSLDVHFERKEKCYLGNVYQISSFESKLSIPVQACTVCCTGMIHSASKNCYVHLIDG